MSRFGLRLTLFRSFTVGLLLGAMAACGSRPPPPRPPLDGGVAGGGTGGGVGASGAGGGASGVGLPVAQACPRLNARRCEALRRCGLVGDDTGAYRDCVAFFTATWCGPTRWLPRVEVGTLRYDPVRAQACADDFLTRACADVTTEPSSCQRFLSPAVPLGGGCYDGFSECVDGVCRGGGCPRRCLSRGGVGESCLTTADCATGLTCRPGTGSSGNQCATPSLENEPCGPTQPCGPGLACVGASCRRLPLPEQACLQGRCDETSVCVMTADGGLCEARRDAGVTCDDDSECLPTMLCDATLQACAPQQLTAPGAECSARQRCPAGTTCLLEQGTNRGTCGALRDDGGVCQRATDCQGHLTCVSTDGGSVCAPRREDGAPCATARECRAFSTCVSGTCVPLPALGDACAADRPCLWGTCLDGPDGGSVCAETQGPGQPCRSGNDCASGRCDQGTCTAACLP